MSGLRRARLHRNMTLVDLVREIDQRDPDFGVTESMVSASGGAGRGGHHANDLLGARLQVVYGAQKYLVVIGSRSCGRAYLEAIEGVLAGCPRLVTAGYHAGRRTTRGSW
jgi:hypothetical protein